MFYSKLFFEKSLVYNWHAWLSKVAMSLNDFKNVSTGVTYTCVENMAKDVTGE